MERNKIQVVCFDNDMGDNEGPERGAIAVHDLVIRFDHKEKGQCCFSRRAGEQIPLGFGGIMWYLLRVVVVFILLLL